MNNKQEQAIHDVQMIGAKRIMQRRNAKVEFIMDQFAATVPADLRQIIRPYISTRAGDVILRLPKHRPIQIYSSLIEKAPGIYFQVIFSHASNSREWIHTDITEAMVMADYKDSRYLGVRQWGFRRRLAWLFGFIIGVSAE